MLKSNTRMVLALIIGEKVLFSTIQQRSWLMIGHLEFILLERVQILKSFIQKNKDKGTLRVPHFMIHPI